MIPIEYDPLMDVAVLGDVERCIGCGCDDQHACADVDGTPCSWAAEGLCSACVHRAETLYAQATGRAA